VENIPFLTGRVEYTEDGEWLVDLGEMRGQVTLALFATANPGKYLPAFQRNWINGRFVTRWGHYLYKEHQKLSVGYLVRPYTSYHGNEDAFASFVGI
jgi:hypothetical protein